jgi:hypothetical protein
MGALALKEQYRKAADQYVANVPFLKFGENTQKIRRHVACSLPDVGGSKVRRSDLKNSLFQWVTGQPVV